MTPPLVAETVTQVGVATGTYVTGNVRKRVFAGTVTDAGTEKFALSLVRMNVFAAPAVTRAIVAVAVPVPEATDGFTPIVKVWTAPSGTDPTFTD